MLVRGKLTLSWPRRDYLSIIIWPDTILMSIMLWTPRQRSISANVRDVILFTRYQGSCLNEWRRARIPPLSPLFYGVDLKFIRHIMIFWYPNFQDQPHAKKFPALDLLPRMFVCSLGGAAYSEKSNAASGLHFFHRKSSNFEILWSESQTIVTSGLK
jgi:hypothetical protein